MGSMPANTSSLCTCAADRASRRTIRRTLSIIKKSNVTRAGATGEHGLCAAAEQPDDTPSMFTPRKRCLYSAIYGKHRDVARHSDGRLTPGKKAKLRRLLQKAARPGFDFVSKGL